MTKTHDREMKRKRVKQKLLELLSLAVLVSLAVLSQSIVSGIPLARAFQKDVYSSPGALEEMTTQSVLELNTASAPLSDPRVRQALWLAFDEPAQHRTFIGGDWMPFDPLLGKANKFWPSISNLDRSTRETLSEAYDKLVEYNSQNSEAPNHRILNEGDFQFFELTYLGPERGELKLWQQNLARIKVTLHLNFTRTEEELEARAKQERPDVVWTQLPAAHSEILKQIKDLPSLKSDEYFHSQLLELEELNKKGNWTAENDLKQSISAYIFKQHYFIFFQWPERKSLLEGTQFSIEGTQY